VTLERGRSPVIAGAEPRGRTQRITALDFTKGVLVFIMVLYHWLNYFVKTEYDIYRYLRFLTPSFIFITGFLLSHAYLSKYRAGAPGLSKRLLQRGVKILGLFIVLNVVIAAISPATRTGAVGAGHWWSSDGLTALFVMGVASAGAGKSVSFYILIPIAYLLLLSALLLAIGRTYKYTFHVVSLLFMLGIFILYLRGIESPNLELLTIGLLGAVCGYMPLVQINRYANKPVALALAYVCYLVAITIWNVRFPLQVIGVCLTLLLIYKAGSSEREPGRLRRHIILAGKYSLFAYIAQVAILQVLHRSLRLVDPGVGVLLLSFLAGLCLTSLAIEIVDRARSRAPVADRLYTAVFA